jgi:hypothetical protein
MNLGNSFFCVAIYRQGKSVILFFSLNIIYSFNQLNKKMGIFMKKVNLNAK